MNQLDLHFDRLSLGANGTHGQLQPQTSLASVPLNKLDIPRRRGIVKFFNSLKGFGFVVDNDPGALGGQEVFCHFSAISGKGGFRSLAEGEEVEYELVQGPKGFQAANLTGPGGRTVVGDPKARLAKPPPYLPFAPLAMQALGGYGDPFQYPGAYGGSPYTQHVVYVPSTMALPSQYGYSHPNIASQQGPSGSDRTLLSNSYGNRGPYQSYTTNGAQPYAPGPPGQNGSPSPPFQIQQSGLSASDSIGPVPSQAIQGNSSRVVSASSSSSFGGPSSPPSQPPSFGFAPFSPPTFNHAALFGGTGGPSFHSPPSNSPPKSAFSLPPQGIGRQSNGMHNTTGSNIGTSQFASTLSSSSHSSGSGAGVLPAGSALFGPASTSLSSIGAIGSGSRSGTPHDRRPTPLGNGSLSGTSNGADWKAPILYTSTSDYA